jgi:two-component system C4-dicarboxylate transport sensor histidine kinase DctB
LSSGAYETDILAELKTNRQVFANGKLYQLFDRPIAITGWRLNVLENMQSAKDAGRLAGTIAFLSTTLIGLLVMLLFSRARQRMFKERQEKANALRLERKVVERTRDLVNANKLLEGEIAVRHQAENALVKAQKELIQAGKLAGLGQMSAALSHEFNQPLAAIKSYADNASQYLEKNRLQEVNANIRHIVELTDRMASISKHLRNFARRPKEKIGPVNILSVVDDALEIIASKLKASKAILKLEIPESLPEVMGGHNRLQQVLVNLISNAIDAKKPGKKCIITLSGWSCGDKVVLTMEDNGTGFETEVIEQIFDPFFTTKDVNKGLGLGLSISYNIIKDFGGNITAFNKPEGGAKFVIELVPNIKQKMKAAQ